VAGTTFLSGLVPAFKGITPQTERRVYPLLALLTGAVGVALALRLVETSRVSYLVALGIGVWLGGERQGTLSYERTPCRCFTGSSVTTDSLDRDWRAPQWNQTHDRLPVRDLHPSPAPTELTGHDSGRSRSPRCDLPE